MRIDRELCDVCGTCVSVCPTSAIRVLEFEVVIDDKLCVRCGSCRIICPFHAIREEE
jgi:ferredoxin